MPKQYEDLLLKEVKELLKKLPPNVRIRVYYDGMGKSKYTLNQLGSKIDQIADLVVELSNNLKKVNNQINQINARLDGIDARLDYNGLKQLPESK